MDPLRRRPNLAMRRPNVSAEQGGTGGIHDAQLKYLVASIGTEPRGLYVDADDPASRHRQYPGNVAALVPQNDSTQTFYRSPLDSVSQVFPRAA